ncbi:MAG TPA: carboxypeptidase-like regulatory domain-containing protein [Pyrinomonadaceae bacterium]|nr:carboxypeptidase-like regulatory domain-containing protein [Pyrinomonadaceae bacterium]
MKRAESNSTVSTVSPFSVSRVPILLLMTVLFLSLAGSVLGQGGTRGAISGTVKDEKGAALAGAQVDVINAATGVTERTTTSDSNGNFTVNQLPAGDYRLVVSVAGFSKAEVPDVKVNVTETTTVNVPLKVGQISESVTVTGAATDIQLTSPATGQTLSDDTISALPLATRNFLTLLTLSTGANTEMFQSDALGRGAVTINVNGQRPVNNNYSLEGINANDINLPILDNVPLPNPQTVQEFKTQTSLYDASQGRNGGGNIQVALKSGSNEFHGDAFEFLRNDKLNANDFFRNRDGQERPRYRQNVYGFSLGGPIYLPRFGEGGRLTHSGKNRHFFFFNFQGTRAASGTAAGTNFATNIPVLPTNRSEANLIATFFPSGLPPGFTHLDPVALALLNLPGGTCPGFGGDFCIPTLAGTPGFNSGGTLNRASLNRASLGTFKDDQLVLSTDHQLTTNNKLTFRYFQSDSEALRPFGAGGTLKYAQHAPAFNKFVKIGLTSVITPRLVNDFRAGFNRFFFATIPDEPITLGQVGATRGNSAQFPGLYQAIVAGTGFSIGAGVNDDRGGTFNTYVLGDDVSFTAGNHQFRFGGEGSKYELNRYNNFATRGSVSFQNTAAGAGGAGIPALVGLQNFLLGRVTTTQGRAGFSTFYFRARDMAFYAQDDWKFTSRLNVNMGFRLEGLSIAHEKFNFLSNFRGLGDGTAPPLEIINPEDTPVVGDPGVSRCTMLDCFKFYPAPRVGFAYDVFGNQSTVVRGGYGVYFQRVSNQSLLQTSGGSPFSEDFSAAPFTVTTTNPFPGQRPNSDFPLPTVAVVPRLTGFDADGAPIFNSGSGFALGGFRFFPERDFQAPYAQQWNLTVQRQLPKKFVAEIGYVGTNGKRLIGTGAPVNPGQICTLATPCVIPASLATLVAGPAGTLAPGTVKNSDGSITITRSDASNIDARVPAQYLGLANNRLFAQTQNGFSGYHSLQASLNRHFSDGIYLQAAYTYAKSLDNGSGSSFGDELNGLLDIGDLLNARSNKGLSDFDRTHRLVISYNYEFPLSRWLGGPRKLVDGWSINGISTFQSGTPFLIADFSAYSLQDTEFINGSRATLGTGTILTTGSIYDRLDNFVNLDAFIVGGRCVNDQNQIVGCADPASTGYAAFGTLGRNVFRGPFQTNHDMSVVKRTNITERVNLEFRAEAFNVFNHPTFQSPQAQGGSFGNYGIVDASSGDSSILATANRPRTIQFGLKLNF